MQLTEEFEFSTGTLDPRPVAECSHRAGGFMESGKQCAYNHTRECFLGLDVHAADLSMPNLRERVQALALRSGEGLWLNPFRGIPESGMRAPLDLIYLDSNSRVIETVESFPTFRVSEGSAQAASVLALPTHSIYSSQTQPGDQLVLCAAEDMERRLESIANPGVIAQPPAVSVVQGAVLLREKPLWSGGPGLLELEDRSTEPRPETEKPHVMSLLQPGSKAARPPKSWLERWWSPDPRKAPRETVPGLAAYYWTGGPPEAHSIRDVSSTGLYVVTEERWYPGTLVLMTLQTSAGTEQTAERTICVHSRAVRWGNDGVGLQFVLPKSQDQIAGMTPLMAAADKRELDRFLQRLRKGKR
jgi:hypothetical protein